MANVLKYGFEFSSASHASPELSSAQNCFKMTLTIANIIFLIFGCVLCGVGAYALQSKAGSLAGQTLPQGVIVLGVFIILISFLGCLAAFKESRFFLGVYSFFLGLFVIILLAIGIGVLAKKDAASTYMVDGWCAAPPTVQTDIQNYFLCCGLYQYQDSIARTDPDGTVIHPACPRDPPTKYGTTPLACPVGVTKGNALSCLSVLQASFESSYQAAGGCCIAFAVLMGIGMAIVCFLMSGIKEKNHLEEIRKLHRKLREAKEDPTQGGLAGLHTEGDTGYGEVEMGAGVGPYDAQPVEGGLDTEVQLDHVQVQQEGSPSSQGAAAAAVVSPNRSSARASKKKSYQPSPVDEEPYEEEAAPAAVPVRSSGRGGRAAAPAPAEEDSYDEESTTAGGYAQRDEYDEEEN